MLLALNTAKIVYSDADATQSTIINATDELNIRIENLVLGSDGYLNPMPDNWPAPRIKYVYPRLKIRSLDTGSWIEVIPLGNRRFMGIYNFPQNLTEHPIVYRFELYANELATGLLSTVTVWPEAVDIRYYQPESSIVIPEDLPYTGGESSFFINFNPPDDVIVEQQLPYPSNIRMTGSILTWDPVEHAVAYDVYVDGDFLIRATGTTEVELPISVGPGKYYIQLRSISESGYSELSPSVTNP
jgi:hypothetical protein